MGMNINKIIGVLVAILVLLVVGSALIPVAFSSSQDLNATNSCEALGCTFNASETEQCRDSVNNSFTCADGQGIPQGNSFVVVITLVMIALFVIVLAIVIKKMGLTKLSFK